MKRVGVDLTRCVGCGVCVRACPLGVLELSEGHAAVNARRHCMECMHCAAACPVRAITWGGLSPEALYVPTPEDPVVRAVMTRRSTRHFRPDCPDRALLARVLDAAEYAPSSKNEHKNRWTAVLGKDKTDALIDPVVAWGEANGRPELKKQRERGINMITCGAPCLIVGHIPMTANNPEGDVVIAMTTAELLLARAGLSTCWGGYLKRAIAGTPALRRQLGIPDGDLVAGVLMTGWADGEHYINVPWHRPADISWR